MGTFANAARLTTVAAAYAAAFFLVRRAIPFRLDSPWFVAIAMICFLGLATLLHPVVPVRMPRALRRIRRWEIESGLYRRLAVRPFGTLLRRTPLRLLNTAVYRTGRTGEEAALSAQLEAAEASHFWDAVLVVPYMIHAGWQGMWIPLFWITLAQVGINLYPIMHLRLARHRMGRLCAKRPLRRSR